MGSETRSKGETWELPVTGFGEYQDYFEDCYNKAEKQLLKDNPKWASDEYDDERIGGACNIAVKKTLKHIKSLGITVVYPKDEEL